MRFEDVTSDIERMVDKMVDDNFPELRTANITILFDTKKRKSGGQFVMGRLKKANDETKALAVGDDGVAPDYVLFIDKNIYDVLDDNDKKRLLFHQLCHVHYDGDCENPYKVKGPEIQTFYAEIEYNKDDPRWAERLSAVAESVYDPENSE